ncbi:DNA-directed RNA polymerase subunit beta' [bacterium (Candidatus Torokbacteria) CG_4_10_14_0_2_um_filter_35_8]|nr:MAG: DNA-directed RNA polymerase subunit beta' [bacterium (Candidatus Torokbacteria) CG_4_10_14_0_2_um_filter_35_8]
MATIKEQLSNFSAIRLRLASPKKILEWSNGEVLRPETINYRTQKPEKDGLFCERIFGPIKDWQCYCGKYKRMRYEGVICDKCGVEVTRSIVRRERMGHIKLATPVAHIWFLRGMPFSRIGAVLDLTVQQLEKVVYFASYIVTDVDQEAKRRALHDIEKEYKKRNREARSEFEILRKKVQKEKFATFAQKSKENKKTAPLEEKKMLDDRMLKQLKEIKRAKEDAMKEVQELEEEKIISELSFRDLSMKYGQVFKAGIGAEAIRKLLERMDLKTIEEDLIAQIAKTPQVQRRKLMKKLKFVQGMLKAKIRPEWMCLTMVPVIPPDLRPMVQLDGGRYATSDLNDLYRRVVNRNNRLKKLMEIGAPDVITRNEKRMLQEAVDALLDNSARHSKEVPASTGQRRKLKSLADMLKGKQGRFRQNLLGKRVDYSGRSVIVVGPKLTLGECGLPKMMALELFKPFIIHELIEDGFAHNVRSASKLIEDGDPCIWDKLERVSKNCFVLLNRAPTLHRLGIQAFRPRLIESKAIELHPMVCKAFNADFDGDQMAVHLPLTLQARKEAKEIVNARLNLLKPASGNPITTADKDIVLGCYLLTSIREGALGEGKIFSSPEEAITAYSLGKADVQAKVKVRIKNYAFRGKEELTETSIGRVIFNQILPTEIQFLNKTMDRSEINKVISEVYFMFGVKGTGKLVDKVKDLGFESLTMTGLSWGEDDLIVPDEKTSILKEADKEVKKVDQEYRDGLLTEDERYDKTIEIWFNTEKKVEEAVRTSLPEDGSVFAMVDSGSRGSWSQINQVLGMKGLMVSPTGRILELPIRSCFKEGLSAFEYFLSSHGSRKGMTDIALRTADAGYLTRRMADVAQDLVIKEEDCGDTTGMEVTLRESSGLGSSLGERVRGRMALKDIVDPKDPKRIICHKDEIIDSKEALEIDKKLVKKVHARSILECKTEGGLCSRCYGWDLGKNKLVKIGTAVGIIAAQAIGEPGTQLTLGSKHKGGAAAAADVLQGLPRVEELFEVRTPKNEAVVSEISGLVEIIEGKDIREIRVFSPGIQKEEYCLGKKKKGEGKETIVRILVKNGDKVKKGKVLGINSKNEEVKVKISGIVRKEKDRLSIVKEGQDEKTYSISEEVNLLVKNGDLVTLGEKLTEGPVDLKKLFKLTGPSVCQEYVLKEIQAVYKGQGQDINDKHIEVIIRQMLSRALIKDPSDSDFLVGDIVDKSRLVRLNEDLKKKGKKPIESQDLILGISKAALTTGSFLSAASFQETARVLIEASITGAVDHLKGLKENVIIGKLIPAGTGLQERKGEIN